MSQGVALCRLLQKGKRSLALSPSPSHPPSLQASSEASAKQFEVKSDSKKTSAQTTALSSLCVSLSREKSTAGHQQTVAPVIHKGEFEQQPNSHEVIAPGSSRYDFASKVGKGIPGSDSVRSCRGEHCYCAHTAYHIVPCPWRKFIHLTAVC